MRNQCFGAGDIGRRPHGRGPRVNARGAFNGKQPFEVRSSSSQAGPYP